MNITKRQPASVGEMLGEEYLVPMGIMQERLAVTMELVVNQVYWIEEPLFVGIF